MKDKDPDQLRRLLVKAPLLVPVLTAFSASAEKRVSSFTGTPEKKPPGPRQGEPYYSKMRIWL